MEIFLGNKGRGGDFVRIPTENEIFKYVDESLGDDGNNGDSPEEAYQTPQFAVDELAENLGGNMVLQFADDTYDFSAGLRVPQSATGRMTLRGNTTTPGNVVLFAGIAGGTIIGHGGAIGAGGVETFRNNCELIIDGVTLSGGLAGIWANNSPLTIGYIQTLNTAIGVVGIGSSQIFFKNDIDGDSTFSAANGSRAILCGNLGSVTVDQNLNITGYQYGFQMQDTSKLELSDPRTIAITLRDVEGARGISIEQTSVLNGDASISVTGNAGQSDDIGILLSKSSGLFDSIGGGAWSFEDLGQGLRAENYSFLDATSGNFSYNNCIKDAVFDSTSGFKHDANLGTTPIYENSANFTDGRDKKDLFNSLSF